MTQVEVKNKSGEWLVGELHGQPKKKLIIVCHGLADTKENLTFVTLAEELSKLAPVYRFDFSGNGDSEGKFEDSTYHKQVQDLCSVINHFNVRGVEEFCLIGHSMGGGVIKVAAAEMGVVTKCAVALAGVSRAETFKDKFPEAYLAVKAGQPAFFFDSEKYPITKNYIDSAESINIMSYASKANYALLCIVGSEDTLIRKEHEREFMQLMPHHYWAFTEINGADHRFNRLKSDNEYEKTMAELVNLCKAWLIEHFT